MTTNTMDCPEVRMSLGVYVLGAIDPAERSQVDAHLAYCRDCRDELAGLAGLPALLSRVSTEEAIALAADDGPFPGFGETPPPPPDLLGSVLDLTAARRKRRRWRDATIGLAAAAVVAVGVFGGLALGGSGSGSSPTSGPDYAGVANGPWQSATASSGGMSVTVDYRSMGWGTQTATVVNGIPVGTDCKLYVVEANGERVLVGGWQTDKAEGSVWYPSSTGIPSMDVAGFQVTVGSNQSIAVKA